MSALTTTDVADLVAKLNAEYQPVGECVATPRRMRQLLDRLESYTDEVQAARHTYGELGIAAVTGSSGVAGTDVLGGGDVDVAQWRSDMASWQYRLAGYQRTLDQIPDEMMDTVEGCQEIYALVTAPLLDGIHYTLAPGIVLDSDEKARILSSSGHSSTDIPAEHPQGHSNPKPPDVISPFTLGNQIIVYQNFQRENLERLVQDLIDGLKSPFTPSSWPWWLKGTLIAAGGLAVGTVGLYAYKSLPKTRRDGNPARPKSISESSAKGLSPKAEKFLAGLDLQRENAFATFGKGAKKSRALVAELQQAGLVDVYQRGDEILVTAPGRTVKTLYGQYGP